jgi:hypothetical protein
MKALEEIAAAVNARIESVTVLPDGSGCATMSMPLPNGHWLKEEGYNIPPMGLRMGIAHPDHAAMVERVRAAARYAIRASTMNGQVEDFDPDAMVQNMVVGLLGYWTTDGGSSETWDMPEPLPQCVAGISFKS